MSFKLNVIQKEYGTCKKFRQKAERWIESLPEEYFEANKDIKKIRDKDVDWKSTIILRIVHRKMTSIDRIEWIENVVDRIRKMKKRLKRAQIENHEDISSRSKVPDRVQKKLEQKRSNAIDFMKDIEKYALQNLNVTEKQLEALNKTYKNFEQLI